MKRAPYTYRCTDRSVLLPFFRERWAALFLRLMPVWVPANFITLGSSACLWAVPLLGLAQPGPATLALTTAFLIHTYLVADHLDGMQAKRTGTSSALGEWLDHTLDVFHGALVILAVFQLTGDAPRLPVLLALWCSHVAFAVTMAEQRETGELRFGLVGSLEAVVLVLVFLVSWAVPPVRAWWLAPVAGVAAAWWLLIAAGMAGALIAVIDSVRRLGRAPAGFWGFAATHLALASALAFTPLPGWAAAGALMLHAGDYTGRVLGSHLLGGATTRADFFAPLLVALGILPWAGRAALALAVGAGVWLAVRTLRGALGVIAPLRTDWRWSNPRPRQPASR